MMYARVLPNRCSKQVHPSSVLLFTMSTSTGNGSKSNAHTNNSHNYVHRRTAVGLVGMGILTGYAFGSFSSNSKQSNEDVYKKQKALPSGLPRSCCDCEASNKDSMKSTSTSPSDGSCSLEQARALIQKLKVVTGAENVLLPHKDKDYNCYVKGMRLGHGHAVCIAQPGTVREAIDCLRVIVEFGAVVIPQGANTGLTGGSVPRSGADALKDNRPAVVLSMRRLNAIIPIDEYKRVLCLAGAGIASVHSMVSGKQREGHSVLGSLFLNPSVAAGIALGSGGTQIRKGPVYTDRVLYAKVSEDGRDVEVVNTLGVHIDFSDKKNISKVAADTNTDSVIEHLSSPAEDLLRMRVNSSTTMHGTAAASSPDYSNQLCVFNENVARYNGDTRGTEPNRSEGKVLILASIHDTFALPKRRTAYWISCDNLKTALELRKKVVLANPHDLPLSCEYMDRDSFDVVDEAGRVLCAVIRTFGVGDVVRRLWEFKLLLESKISDELCDKILYWLNAISPAPLPGDLMRQGRRYDHHLLLEVGDFDDGGEVRLLERLDKFSKKHKVCMTKISSSNDRGAVQAFRFAAAPAFRTWCVGMGVQGVSVDYALPKNAGFAPALNTDVAKTIKPIKRMRYSHFGCNVVHEDLAYPLESDTHAAKLSLKNVVEQMGGKLPAEHGHGTEYVAPVDVQNRWKLMDPSNTMNPGLGGLSTKPFYKT